MLFALPTVHSVEQFERASLTGAVLVDLADVDVEQLTIFLDNYSANTDFYVRGPATLSVDDALKMLNAGCRCLVLPATVAADFVKAGIPSERLVVLAADMAAANELVALGAVAGVVIPESDPVAARELAKKAESLVPSSGRLVSVFVPNAVSGFAEMSPAVPIIDARQLESTSEISLPDVLISRLVSDRTDGLFYTVVTDSNDKLLGTCFSNPESIREAFRTKSGVYFSRKRGLWHKGASSGATQKLLAVSVDCDGDALQFIVKQNGPGFCHNNSYSCFGEARGLDRLESVVNARKTNAPEGSYTKRLFSDPSMLAAKIMEEAEELCEATTPSEIAWEAADLIYFMMVKLSQNGVSMRDVNANLDAKDRKVTRRRGDAKEKWAAAIAGKGTSSPGVTASKEPAHAAVKHGEPAGPIRMHIVDGANVLAVEEALRRPAQSSNAFELARPIIEKVRADGDRALLELTEKFDRVKLANPVLKAPFPAQAMQVTPALKNAIDLAISNVEKFHAAQLTDPLQVETVPGVLCSRFSRPIAKVGLYVPGGSAILPSTAIMLGVPALVAGCKEIILASPPGPDGTLPPEIVYVAHKIGASQIVLAGGAQAVAAMAYGTESVTKVDKILGPGNQFVTAAKMIVQSSLQAQVSIDMPAGPSEVLVVADAKASKPFVVSDLLSQAEHGPDSQVILIAIDWTTKDVEELQVELERQALALPRCDIIRKSISHSSILLVSSRTEAVALSNQYAPEHLILQVEHAERLVEFVENAGSVFVGAYSPESCGDYTSGTNHTLPTYGYANQYSGVNTGTFLKYITSQQLTPEGIANIGPATVALAEREGLEAHANAVRIRLARQ